MTPLLDEEVGNESSADAGQLNKELAGHFLDYLCSSAGPQT